jgi:hypothetical protein
VGCEPTRQSRKQFTGAGGNFKKQNELAVCGQQNSYVSCLDIIPQFQLFKAGTGITDAIASVLAAFWQAGTVLISVFVCILAAGPCLNNVRIIKITEKN